MIKLETDFAVITVKEKENVNTDFLIRHGLHQLLKEYKRVYGANNIKYVLEELYGYHME
jgi:hypothetical protein